LSKNLTLVYILSFWSHAKKEKTQFEFSRKNVCGAIWWWKGELETLYAGQSWLKAITTWQAR
jgi:hypothetical protein